MSHIPTHSGGFTPEYLMVTLVYTLLVACTLYGAFLYWRAYNKMKRTPMIAAVFFGLAALTVDNLYWAVVTAEQGYGGQLADILLIPWFAAIPKILLLCAVAYFLHASLAPSPHEPVDKKCLDEAGQCAHDAREVEKNGKT